MLLAVALQRELEDVVFVVFVGENVRRRGRVKGRGRELGVLPVQGQNMREMKILFCLLSFERRKTDERNTKN